MPDQVRQDMQKKNPFLQLRHSLLRGNDAMTFPENRQKCFAANFRDTTLEATSKMSIGQISALGSRFKFSPEVRMRDGNSANKRGGTAGFFNDNPLLPL